MTEPQPRASLLARFLSHAPGILLLRWATPLPGWPPRHQFGQGKEEESSSDLPSPPSHTHKGMFMVTAKWRLGHWEEMTAVRGMGAKAWG